MSLQNYYIISVSYHGHFHCRILLKHMRNVMAIFSSTTLLPNIITVYNTVFTEAIEVKCCFTTTMKIHVLGSGCVVIY